MAGIAEELSQLVALQKQGVLTPEEFEQQKARLLRGGDSGAAPAPAAPASNRGAMMVAAAVVLAVVALAGAYAGGLFGRSHSGAAAPMVASQAGTAAAGSPAAPQSGGAIDGAIPAANILAAFKADPVAAKAQYGHALTVSATVLKVSGSRDTLRIDGGDPNLRVFMDAVPGMTFDPGLVGHKIYGSCQAPFYDNVDGEQMLSFNHCSVEAEPDNAPN